MSTGEDWTAIRNLFERALDADDPPQWVAGQRDVATQVRGEVLSLLHHHRTAGNFLEQPPQLLDDPVLPPGTAVGSYTIVRQAGTGGRGRVYVANDERLRRRVAIKALRPRSGSALPDELRREARAAAALNHPGICTVYALEEIDGELFMVSELVEGRTLRQEFNSGPPPSAEHVLATARQLAAALACAHGAGVVHGDLKPENVMRTYDGRLKVLDFGLARVTHDPDLLLGGTPGYMPPEVVNGQPADRRADVFAFGVLLYEQACGVHPFAEATSEAIVERVLTAEPTPILERRPEFPRALAEMIDRCLRKAPAERFGSASDVTRRLEMAGDSPAPRALWWWRAHQLVVCALYATAAAAGWWIRSAGGGWATSLFPLIAVAATAAAIVRGHLLFSESLHRIRFAAERRRSAPLTLALDAAIALLLLSGGALVGDIAPLGAAAAAALGVGLAIARLLIEPSTTRAAWPAPPDGD
jgi:hypothetical protein